MGVCVVLSTLHAIICFFPLTYCNYAFCFWQKDCEYLSGHQVFLRRVASAFDNFAESTEKSCREKLTTTCPLSHIFFPHWKNHVPFLKNKTEQKDSELHFRFGQIILTFLDVMKLTNTLPSIFGNYILLTMSHIYTPYMLLVPQIVFLMISKCHLSMLLCCRCMEDLVSTTRYVSWSLHNKVGFEMLR